MEDRLHKRTLLINNKNKNRQNDPLRPSNAILPPDLFNDIYDDVKFNGGSGRNLFREPYSMNSD